MGASLKHVPGALSTINFVNSEIVLADGGLFECRLSTQAIDSDLSVVIDVYDLDNPVHPDGHLGWWKFPVNRLSNFEKGLLSIEGGIVHCELGELPPAHFWENDCKVPFKRLVINAVLRANITNAIVYLDKVPAFKSRKDLAKFRTGFSREWSLPRFATLTYVFPRTSTVRIVSRNIFPRDAVGNLCLDVFKLLQQNNIPVEIYAENTDLALNDMVRRVDRLVTDIAADDQLLYFFSTFDPNLEHLLSLKVKRLIAYFHGVTKPELLQVFDPELSVTCLKGIAQIALLQKFDLLAANSRVSAATLVSMFDDDLGLCVDDIRVIPPRLMSAGSAQNAPSKHLENKTKLLYVGRIKSHKKIEHLLELFGAYLKLDADAELWIVGGGADKAYWNYLKWVELMQLKLPAEKVHWAGSVTDTELAEHYASASAYVSMSEDEGFCLPVFEAMLAGAPVFAYGLPAVREVMQDNGVYFLQKDYELLAAALHALLHDSTRVEEITVKQLARAKILMSEMSGRGFLGLFEPAVAARKTKLSRTGAKQLPAKAGGFELRTDSPDTRRLTDAS